MAFAPEMIGHKGKCLWSPKQFSSLLHRPIYDVNLKNTKQEAYSV